MSDNRVRRGLRIEYDMPETRMIASTWFEESDATDEQIRAFWNNLHPTRPIRRIWRNQEIPESEKEVQP